MTNDTETFKKSKIYEIELDESFEKDALQLIKDMVKGNGIDPNVVKIEKFDGQMLQFNAENTLTIETKISKKKIPGRVTGPIAVDNPIAAKEAIKEAYRTLSEDTVIEQKIRDVILKREDKGFALDNSLLQLDVWKKEFVIFEPCHSCKTTGSVKCLPCAGKGLENCPRCSGSGVRICSHCSGGQTIIGSNNQQIQCPTCNGEGRIPCALCTQSGRIQCKTCRSKGVTKCPNCQGNAWHSDIQIVEIEAKTAFNYPRDVLPEKVVEVIDKHGDKLYKNAEIKVPEELENLHKLDGTENADQRKNLDENGVYNLVIVYEVFLPYAEIVFDIDGSKYEAFLFGNNGKLIDVSPFIDELIRVGVHKLQNAAELKGNVGENLKNAAKYRTIKEAIIYSASRSLGKARAALKKTNRIGLSNDAIKSMVSTIDVSLKNITRKPRNIGLAISAIVDIALFSIYFLSPVRNMIISNLSNQNIHVIIDLLILSTSIYIGILTIQMAAQNAINKVMRNIGIAKTATPKLGDKLYWNIGLSVFIFLAVIEASRAMNIIMPIWYVNLFI